jgi:acetolactate synthase regulatory subunit
MNNIREEVDECLERHGFKRNISDDKLKWHTYESAKQWVNLEVTITGYREYDVAINQIEKYLNV